MKWQVNRRIQSMKREVNRKLEFAESVQSKTDIGQYEQGYFAGQVLILKEMLDTLAELETRWKP